MSFAEYKVTDWANFMFIPNRIYSEDDAIQSQKMSRVLDIIYRHL